MLKYQSYKDDLYPAGWLEDHTQGEYWETCQVCSVTFEKSLCYCVIKESPTRPSVRLRVYFIFQSQAVWCTCSKDTIWYFGFLFLFSRGGVSSAPEALSRMGWLHMENMYAPHAYNNLNSVPVIEKKNRKKHFCSFYKYAADAVNIFECSHHVCLYTCVCFTN